MLKTNVYLNGLSGSFETSVKAIRAFLANHPALKVDKYLTLVGNLEEINNYRAWLGPAASRIWLNTDYYQPEKALEAFLEFEPGDLALFPPGVFGTEMAGRLAARLKSSAVLGISELIVKRATQLPRDETQSDESQSDESRSDGILAGLTVVAKKAVYSQNLQAELRLNQRPFCLTLAKEWLSKGQDIEKINLNDILGLDLKKSLPAEKPGHLIEHLEFPIMSKRELSQAQTLVVGGFGLAEAEGVKKAGRLAEALGADWGVTRPVAMNAWAPLDRLIGVSGAMTAPKWVLALGASGAAAFLSGINQAQHIAAVNLDYKAPIIGQSDLAVVGEAGAILEELIKLAKS
jgi:electron transfer flavoprotein alpha subunit